MISISDAVIAAAARNPDAVAVAGGSGAPVTYGELRDRVTSLAALLRKHTSPGARVAIVSRKSAETVVAMLAALWGGWWLT